MNYISPSNDHRARRTLANYKLDILRGIIDGSRTAITTGKCCGMVQSHSALCTPCLAQEAI